MSPVPSDEWIRCNVTGVSGRAGNDTEAQQMLDVLLHSDVWIGDDGQPLDYLPEREERIGTLALDLAAVAAAARAEAVAGVQALADDFHERAQNFTNQTDIARACRAGWLAAARDLRAAVAPPTDTDPCTCRAGDDAGFPAMHATPCPRFARVPSGSTDTEEQQP